MGEDQDNTEYALSDDSSDNEIHPRNSLIQNISRLNSVSPQTMNNRFVSDNDQILAVVFQNRSSGLRERIRLNDREWDNVLIESTQKDKEADIMINDSHEMIENCKHTSIMLLNLTNDLMDLAKQENLTFQLHKSYFNLLNTIKNSTKTLEFLSSKKNIKVSLVKDDKNNVFFENFYGDEKRYEQILINFLSNALKFTNDEGTVDIILQIIDI